MRAGRRAREAGAGVVARMKPGPCCSGIRGRPSAGSKHLRDHKRRIVILTFILTWSLVSLKSFELLSNLKLERVKGIEPSSQAWEARILPLNHTRVRWANL
jgi:hypothetical protein